MRTMKQECTTQYTRFKRLIFTYTLKIILQYTCLNETILLQNWFSIVCIMRSTSVEKLKFPCSENSCLNLSPPRDSCNGVFFLFCAFGVMSYLPWYFFVNAHEYWMYKFRDVSQDDNQGSNSNDLTGFQKNFTIVLSVLFQVFSILSVVFSLFFAYKLSYNFKLFFTLSFSLLSFVFLTIFIDINTDTWQTGFFVLVIVIAPAMNFVNYIFAMHNFSIVAQFPDAYLKSYVNSQGLVGIFISILQIVSLAIGVSTTSSAWIYFSIGGIFIASTLFYAVFIQTKSRFFQNQMSTYKQNIKHEMLTRNEIKRLTKKIFPAILLMLAFLLATNPVYPACTSIISSMNEGNGNEWNDVYFIPVVGFLLPSVANLFGKTIASVLPNFFSVPMLLFVSFVNISIFVPLIIMCNVPGKSYVPTFFGDTSYIIIIILSSILNGYVVGMSVFIIPTLVEPYEAEDSFHIYMVTSELLGGATSFIGFIFVNLL